MKYRILSLLLLALLLLTGCQSNQTIVTGVDEKEANLIVVFLESKGISAEKNLMAVSGAGAATDTGPKFNINVSQGRAIDAMAILNRNGLPRKQGTNLLTLFAKQGLTTSQKEENRPVPSRSRPANHQHNHAHGRRPRRERPNLLPT